VADERVRLFNPAATYRITALLGKAVVRSILMSLEIPDKKEELQQDGKDSGNTQILE